MLAARLSEDPSHSVCLIEAGDDPSPGSLPPELRLASMIDARHERYLWHHTARATDLRPVMAIPSGRVVGGSSAINTTVYLWALRQDLDVELVYRFIRDTVWVAVRWYRPGAKLSHHDIADQYLTILLDGIATRRRPIRRTARSSPPAG